MKTTDTRNTRTNDNARRIRVKTKVKAGQNLPIMK